MKPIHALATLLLALMLASCSGSGVEAPYDSDTCERLAVKIENRDSLTQAEYQEMIGQNAAILHYLVDKSKEISEEPQGDRSGSWRELLADPEYLERFSYMFTLGSALYQAAAEGLLDKKNKERYASLDKYNQELADYSERN